MAHTPGPWKWRINRSTKRIYLTGRGLTVMDFVRYGMSNAAPRFLDAEHLMQRADELAINIPGESHHSHWNQDINHDDARLIAAAPILLLVLKEYQKYNRLKNDSDAEIYGLAESAIMAAEGEDKE
jgi:hypothetical protein